MRAALCFLAASFAAFAQLPELKVEATDGGSALTIRNTHATSPLTAYLIELVDYPGSSFALSHDELALGGTPLPAGQARRIPITNMTVGAAPDYVKMVAALYADGSSAGDGAKVEQLRSRRKLCLATIQKLIQSEGRDAGVLESELPPVSGSKTKRSNPEVVDREVLRGLLRETAVRVQKGEDAATELKRREAALSRSN